MEGSLRSHPPYLISQSSIAEEDLFGSGEDEGGDEKDKTNDEVFTVVPLDEHVVPAIHDDVFMRNSDQVVPFSSTDSSSSADQRRIAYRLSRESDNIDELSIRRSSSLPDIVPKVVDIEVDSLKGKKQNLSDNSPDVVSSSENKSSSSSDHIQPMIREHLPILRQKSRESKRTARRSVSFKDNVEEDDKEGVSDEENSSSSAKCKRKQFRSSGYGTGSDKGSVPSQGSQGSQSSVFDNSFSMGTSSDAESDQLDGHGLKCCFTPVMAMLGMNICKPSGILNANRNRAPRAALSPSSNESDSEKVTVRSTGKPVQEMIPLLSAIDQPSIMKDSPPNPSSSGGSESRQHQGSNSSVEINQIIDIASFNKNSSNSSSDSIQIPNFDVLLNDGSSNSSGSTSEPTDHLKHVQKKYCKNDASYSRSPPSFATCLPPSPINESMDTGIYSRATSDMDQSQPLPSEEVFDYRSCKEDMTRAILQQKISENYMLELIRSPITPSPRDFTCSKFCIKYL